MKHILLPVLLVTLGGLALNSCAWKGAKRPPCEPDFFNWMSMAFYQFDTLVYFNKKSYESGLTNPKMARDIVIGINMDKVKKTYKKACQKNRYRKWDKAYLVYNHIEGEANIAFFSVVFFRGSRMSGITYNYNLDRYYYKLNKVSEQDLDALRTVADSGGYNILIISKIDPDCRVLDTQMLIGIAFSDFQAIFDMYDDSMF